MIKSADAKCENGCYANTHKMKPNLSDQLREIKLDNQEYGHLPRREIVYHSGVEEAKEWQKQWAKLLLIRRNLKIVNRYIETNRGETINQWAHNNNDRGISHIVLKAIGDHNNETGGISAYFLNLQEFYDCQEKKYDEIEVKVEFGMPENIKRILKKFRQERIKYQKERAKLRKLKLKDLKKEGKGFLMVEAEEPEAKKEPPVEVTVEGAREETGKAVTKTNKKIGIWIAGTLITITLVSVVAALNKK